MISWPVEKTSTYTAKTCVQYVVFFFQSLSAHACSLLVVRMGRDGWGSANYSIDCVPS